MNRYLVHIEVQRPQLHTETFMVEDKSERSPQEFAEDWFKDHTVMRIYKLVQLYAIGKVRGQ